MGSWLVERRLTKVASRLRSLRAELSIIDEQLVHLGGDAEDQAIRDLVSETAGSSFEARAAQGSFDAMRRHRQRVVDELTDLERQQDELLDRLTASA